MSRLKSISIIVLALLIVVAVYATLFHRTAAPEVTFVSLKGERIATSDLRGNIVSRMLGERDFAKLNALLDEKLREPV